jgi:hypothetical protein
MQMRFTRLGRKERDHRSLPHGVTAQELAVGQLLGLASSAGFAFEVLDGRLVTITPAADWRLWPAIKSCLDDIGADRVIGYLERTAPDRRRMLSSAA